MNYIVHVYRVVRQPMEIEAESQQAAIEKAKEVPADIFECFDTEEVTGYLVDEDGDEQYENSCTYTADGVLETAAEAQA